jgi:transposase
MGGSIRRRWRLRRRLMRAVTWREYSAAGLELDELDGRDPWRDSPAGYGASGVTTAARQLREAREAGKREQLMQLMSTMMVRNHLQIDRPALHTECRVGTKRSIEQLVTEQVAALRWLAQAARLDAKADASSVPAAIDFFERSIVCLGHTALCLSGGGSLAMYRKHCRSRSARTAADPHARRDCDLEFLRSAAADPLARRDCDLEFLRSAAADPHARRDCDLEFLRSAAADPHVWRTPISQDLSS